MNDRFKFRVWDGTSYVDDMYLAISRKGNLIYPLTGDIMNPNVFCVEQCTGLKDKNGKLIYEGDVVKTVTGAIGEVVWMNCGFMVNFPAGYCCSVCVTQEIIGNIHEQEVAE